MTGKSFLVLSISRERRAYVADALRANGAVIVEAMTLHQAEGILRQFRFDALAIDFVGLGLGVLKFLDDLRVDHPETRVIVVGPPVDADVLARVRGSTFHAHEQDSEHSCCGTIDIASRLSMSIREDASRVRKGRTGSDANVDSNGRHNGTNIAGRTTRPRASN